MQIPTPFDAVLEQLLSKTNAPGQISHVERWNCTLRQRLERFVRKTLSFSKSAVMHEVCLLLFLHDYNLNCLNNTGLATTVTFTQPFEFITKNESLVLTRFVS